MRKGHYLDTFRYWFERTERGWDEGLGRYVPDDAGSEVAVNANMLPCLAVLALEGDRVRAARIPRIMEQLVATPPWDPDYHYWNQRFDRLGMEPHASLYSVGGQLSMVYSHRAALGLPQDLMETAMDQVELLCHRAADFARHAADVPINCYVDAQGKIVDAWAIKCDAIRKGIPEDMRWLREGGPSNQLVELWVAAMAYAASGREAFWECEEAIWGRIIEKVEHRRPMLFRNAMDPDYSFLYSADPSGEQGINTHRYTQTAYGIGFLILHANAVAIARKVGRSNEIWEELVRNAAQSAFGRLALKDGTGNMALNSYGWERSIAICYARGFDLHRIVAVADLMPYTAGQLVTMSDAALQAAKEVSGAFPPVLGLKGFHRLGVEGTASIIASALAETILTNPEAFDIEPEPLDTPRCYSGFAWEQKHFVMQTPAYVLTVMGAGMPYMAQKGYLGYGTVATGGEYILTLPGGPYLTPLSDLGRNLFCAQAEGKTLCSSDVHFFNRADYEFRMEVILPDGTRISRGEDFGPSPYDQELENLSLEVSFGNSAMRLTRRFDLCPETIAITDSIEALAEGIIEDCFTRVPIITVEPDGECVTIKALAVGRSVEIQPPCHMGYAEDIPHYDQDFIQSIPNLEWLEIRYPSGYGFTFERLDDRPVRAGISRGEWQENVHMRVDGKNIDYHWIGTPTNLKQGETRSFFYRISPSGRLA
ncbi:MAG: hypothetical protein V1800_13965 [Candidatus Latescibacterota bacterium]